MKAVVIVAMLLVAACAVSAAPSVLLGGVLPTAAVVETAGVPNLHTTTVNLAPVWPYAAAHSLIAAGHGIVVA